MKEGERKDANLCSIEASLSVDCFLDGAKLHKGEALVHLQVSNLTEGCAPGTDVVLQGATFESETKTPHCKR